MADYPFDKLGSQLERAVDERFNKGVQVLYKQGLGLTSAQYKILKDYLLGKNA